VYEAPKPRLCLCDYGAPRFRGITAATLACKLSAVAKFEKFRQARRQLGFPPIHPIKGPSDFGRATLSGIPVVTAVVSSPILRHDGVIVTQRGLEPETGLFLDINGEWPSVMSPAEMPSAC